jgi:pilus assembly protein CpaF
VTASAHVPGQAAAGADALRGRLHARLLETFDFTDAARLKPEDLLARADAHVRALLAAEPAVVADVESVVRGVLDDVFRLGPLEPLFALGEVTDILVVAPDRVFIERDGRLERSDVRFRDGDHLMQVIQRIVRRAGRRIDERSPMVDARLADGSRVNAIIPPLAVDGPQLSIRRFPANPLTTERLVELGSLAPSTARLLEAAVAGRLNIVLSGGAGAGKTTLLNAVSAALGPAERVITIEDAAELRLRGSHVVRLETRAANVEGVGAVEPRDLVRNALRMRPDRIIIGECRGAEAVDMMQAMNTGHDGSMTTLHANSARDAMFRLESLLAMGGGETPVRVLRDYVASAIDMVVHLSRLPDGRRVVAEVAEVGDARDDGVEIRVLHRHSVRGVRSGRIEGGFEATGTVPGFLDRLAARGIELDPAAFVAGPLGPGSNR